MDILPIRGADSQTVCCGVLNDCTQYVDYIRSSYLMKFLLPQWYQVDCDLDELKALTRFRYTRGSGILVD